MGASLFQIPVERGTVCGAFGPWKDFWGDDVTLLMSCSPDRKCAHHMRVRLFSFSEETSVRFLFRSLLMAGHA
eukprot:164240-Pelagomonas_calceolata.AAC.2